MAGFEVIIYGRFWVIAKVLTSAGFARKSRGGDNHYEFLKSENSLRRDSAAVPSVIPGAAGQIRLDVTAG